MNATVVNYMQFTSYGSNRNTQEIRNERFIIWTRQKNVHISAYVAFDKMTDRQTDIKHDKAETLSAMSLSMDRVEMLIPSRR